MARRRRRDVDEAAPLVSSRASRPLQDRRVVLTGASSGIGLEAVRLFAAAGADVALLARSERGLARAVALVEGEGRSARAFVVDIADRSATEAAIEEAAAWLGGIDVFVSNAAAAGWGPFDHMSPEDFDRTMRVTFGGAVDAIRAALPHLEASGGTLVANLSVVGKVPVPLMTPYVAAKHALRGFLGGLRLELRHRRSNVRICMVHPAAIDTPFYDHITSAIDVLPKPLRSRYRPEVVARTLVECAIRPRTDVNVGGAATALTVLVTFARPLADVALSIYGVRGATSSRPAPRPGALWEPSGEGRIHGSHGGRRSLWTAMRLRNRSLLRGR